MSDQISTQHIAVRRTFLKGAAAAAAVAAASGLLKPQFAWATSPPLQFSDIPGTGDVKVVNYALALEDLEADLYAQAIMRLTSGGTNALGIHIAGLNIGAKEDDVTYLIEFGKVEKQHRDLLRGTLRSAAIKPFKYDFGMQSKTRQQVDELIYSAERTGVGAYLGAIKYFATKTYLQIAASIQGTEARHTAVVADILDDLFGTNVQVAPGYTNHNAVDQPIVPDAVLAQISPFVITG